VLAVLGAVGIARTAATGCGRASTRYPGQSSTTPSFWALQGLVAAALVLAVAGFAWRAAQVPGDLDVVERQKASIDQLFGLIEETGPDPLLACGDSVRMTQVREQTALAWKLERPIADVPVKRRPRYGIALSTKPILGGHQLARSGRWRATALPCPSRPTPYSPTSAKGSPMAGVSGATR